MSGPWPAPSDSCVYLGLRNESMHSNENAAGSYRGGGDCSVAIRKGKRGGDGREGGREGEILQYVYATGE